MDLTGGSGVPKSESHRPLPDGLRAMPLLHYRRWLPDLLAESSSPSLTTFDQIWVCTEINIL
jgi:hypothetical protein